MKRMFSFLQGKMLTVIGSVAVCALFWGGLASWGYVSSQKELSSLKEQYTQLQTKLEESIKSKETLENSCKVDKQALADLQSSLTQNKKEEGVAVNNLTTYKPKCPKQTEAVNEKEYVPIDDPFDPEFIRLSESGISN